MPDDTKTPLEQALDDLTTLRDELRVKAHLAGMDLQDFLAAQQQHLDAAQRRIDAATEEAAQHLPEVRKRAEALFDEVAAAFEDARKRL